jgi:hypothetical protein
VCRALCQFLPERPAAVGQVSQEPPREAVLLEEDGLREESPHQKHVRDVRCGELVGDGNAVGGADEAQLHSVDGEGAPLYPRRSLEIRRRPLHLARVQNRKQRRVDDEGLGIADQFGQDTAAQELQETV